MARRSSQLALDLRQPGRGGYRPGAGRKRSPGARVLHRQRERIPGHCPVHVTVKIRKGIPRLRTGRFVRAFRATLAASRIRVGFRVVHYSIQNDHVHLLIEAQGKKPLADGMKSVAARIARAINRVFHRRGSVLHGRFHSRVLRTPREVRNALAYVLLNHRHHAVRAPAQVDPASSGAWFDGWRTRPTGPPLWPRDVAPARTWLMSRGWRKHGLVDLAERPGTH